jgi:prevent-host-death family protein
MGKSMTVSEARDRLADVIGQVQFGGERVVIEKRGKPVAVVVSVEDAAFLDEMENRALGELVRERLKEWEAEGFRTHSHEEVFGEDEPGENG